MDSMRFFIVYAIYLMAVIMSSESVGIQEAMETYKVVPDVLDVAPLNLLKIRFDTGVEAEAGNEINATLVQKDPVEVRWPFQEGRRYTLIGADPDAPPFVRFVLHWLIVNIPGQDIARGELLSIYRGPRPPVGSGFHRYTFLVYQQPGDGAALEFNEPQLKEKNGYFNFSVRNFTAKYHLGPQPLAGNFFRTQNV